MKDIFIYFYGTFLGVNGLFSFNFYKHQSNLVIMFLKNISLDIKEWDSCKTKISLCFKTWLYKKIIQLQLIPKLQNIYYIFLGDGQLLTTTLESIFAGGTIDFCRSLIFFLIWTMSTLVFLL